MIVYEAQNDSFAISTDKAKLDIGCVHAYLSQQSYWAANIPLQKVANSIEHSFCFGVYESGTQIGFARVITDYATFAYLADVFILPEWRGRGLSKWLMAFIFGNPELQHLRRWMLATRDAHGLYTQFGFSAPDKPENLMQRKDLLAY